MYYYIDPFSDERCPDPRDQEQEMMYEEFCSEQLSDTAQGINNEEATNSPQVYSDELPF